MSSAPILDFKVEMTQIMATKRNLKADWSTELAQDLRMFHGNMFLEISVSWFPIYEVEDRLFYERNNVPYDGFGSII